MKNLTAVFEEAKEGGYVCWFEEIPEAMSQGETLRSAKKNLLDALKLVLEYRHERSKGELRKLRARKVNVTTESIPFTAIR
jgi:predicted RNase H-like HicB family nuclease